MVKQIFNEGRVVGLSAWEEYVRQLKSVDPEFDVCTEREWLSSSLAMGSSMILRVPVSAGEAVGSDMYVYQVDMPEGCHLGAANPVSACYFYGECECDVRGWATCVTSYGSLIPNNSTTSPADDSTLVTFETVPTSNVIEDLALPDTPDTTQVYPDYYLRLNEYTKIADGVVIQPGRWSKTGKDSPYKDFEPDLSKKPVVRLVFMEQIKHEFYVLLTGFTNRSIIRGISKFDFGAVDTENPQDGDFIGCECYPWVSKIHFHSSTSSDYMLKSSLKSGSRNVKVETFDDSPIIKITSNNLLDTCVYSRQNNTATGTSTDNFGNPTTTWEGTKDPKYWYSTVGDKNVTSVCEDSSVMMSGKEKVTTYNLNNPYDNTTPIGFKVVNKYDYDDKNTIKNGDHGGWYSIEIDPYQMVKDFIDEVMSRFNYIDKRFDEIEAEIKNEIIHRQNGDKYVLDQIYSNTDGSLSQLIDLINQLLGIVYNPDGDLGLKITWEDAELDDSYDESVTGTIRKPIFSWETDQNGDPIIPSSSDGNIPRAKLNIYSGSKSGASATSFLRSRKDNNEDDLYAK